MQNTLLHFQVLDICYDFAKISSKFELYTLIKKNVTYEFLYIFNYKL